jgi:hypothetical protein
LLRIDVVGRTPKVFREIEPIGEKSGCRSRFGLFYEQIAPGSGNLTHRRVTGPLLLPADVLYEKLVDFFGSHDEMTARGV